MRVLLGIAEAGAAGDALARTLERAERAGDEVTVAVLVDAVGDDPDELERAVRDRIAGAAVDATVRRLEGDPGGELVRVAESEDFDEIALSGGQTSPMGKINIDSVAEFVLLNSHVTVRLLR
jgi:nucleotide-binding universal stress UspA family protein